MRALIFGGAHGVGNGICHLLASNGTQVWYIDKVEGRHQPASWFMRATLPLSIEEARVQLNLRDFWEGDFTHIFVMLGRATHRTFDDTSKVVLDSMISSNINSVFSALKIARAVSKADASYVLMSSTSASQADPGGALHSTMKSAIEGLTRSLAREWNPARVNAIAPGPVLTSKYTENVPEGNKLADAQRSPHLRIVTRREAALAAVGLSIMTGVSGVVLPVDLAASISSRRD